MSSRHTLSAVNYQVPVTLCTYLSSQATPEQPGKNPETRRGLLVPRLHGHIAEQIRRSVFVDFFGE